MSVVLWKGWVTVAPAAGVCQVRRQGESTNRRVSICRDAAGAVVGDWMLVLEADGQLWGLGLLGTAPTPAPDPDPVPDPGGSSLVINVPPTWAGWRVFSPYNGSTQGGFGTSDSGSSFWFGRSLYEIVGTELSYRYEGMAIYAGLKGLEISAAEVVFRSVSASWSSPNVAVALWKAPASKPAKATGAHPAGISLVDSAAVGSQWPAAAPYTFTVPAAWRNHLKAGTANGLGLVQTSGVLNNSMYPPFSASAGAMKVTYQ
ncbi:MAG: hypothetical protein QM753_06770 [Thermomicrobiales bacterium]